VSPTQDLARARRWSNQESKVLIDGYVFVAAPLAQCHNFAAAIFLGSLAGTLQ